MPLYEYVCSACGCRFELLRKLGRADDEAICPACGQPESRRVLSTFAAISTGTDGSRSSVAGSSSCSSCAATSCAGCKH